MIQVRRYLVVACALSLAQISLPALAQADYPNKVVRMLIGFPPGQSVDTLGRAIAFRLSQQFGQQFIVDNRPGAAGIIGTQAAMTSAPDGYTLLVGSSGPLAVNPALYAKLPYDPIKDFAPVAGVATIPLILVVNPNVPIASVAELVAAAKAKPKAINYASGGSGITNHLVMEMFRSVSGIDMTHVPYKGGPAAVTGLIGGQVEVLFEGTTLLLPFIMQGRLRALAVSSSARIGAAPELPTLAEQGYAGFNGVAWIAIMAPASTPAPIVAKLNGAVKTALSIKEVRDQFFAQGVEPMPMSPEELGAFMKTELAKWAAAVKSSGAKLD